jgi:3-hydroxyisobutyrate dehydrogenase
MQAESVLIDHTTASPELARELAEDAAERGVAFLDAPVSGGQSGAEEGILTMMVGGESETFAHSLPVLECYARRVVHMGPVGSGQLTKMVNQVCIAGLVQALAEGLNLADRSGLDVSRVVEAISGGAAQSWQMDNRAETMMAGSYDFGFAVDWMRKDLAIALAEAERCGAQVPITAMVDGFYAQLQAEGGGRLDTSSLLARLARD